MSATKTIYITDRDDRGVLLGCLVGISDDDPLYEVRLAPELIVISHDGQSHFDGVDNQKENPMTTHEVTIDPQDAAYLKITQENARASLRLQALNAAGDSGTPEERIARARLILTFLTEEDEQEVADETPSPT